MRTVEEIKKEYFQKATDLGNIQFQILNLENQASAVGSQMNTLALEAESILNPITAEDANEQNPS